MQRGKIVNWNDMETAWSQIFQSYVCIDTSHHKIILTDSPFHSKEDREKMTQIMFEKFNFQSVCIANQANLCLLASGEKEGIVLESGHELTYAASIHNYQIRELQKLELAGKDITEYFVKLATELGYSFSGQHEIETLRDIKEKLGYVAVDFAQEMEIAKIPEKLDKLYELPDGQVVCFQTQRFRCAEILFQPTLVGMEAIGVHEMVYNCMSKQGTTKPVKIFLAGGSTRFPGFAERLHKELGPMVPSDAKIEIQSLPKDAAWQGGCTMSHMEEFKHLWISRQDYDETGSSVVHSRCVW